MSSQIDILEHAKSAIPDDLWKKYQHLSFSDMAAQPELEPWADMLQQAEYDRNVVESAKG